MKPELTKQYSIPAMIGYKLLGMAIGLVIAGLIAWACGL